MTPSQNESFSLKEIIVGTVLAIEADQIFATHIMAFFQRFLADRNEFTPVGRGTRRLGKPFYGGRPENILLAVEHALDIGLKRIVILNRDAVFKFAGGANRLVIVFSAPFGGLCGSD